MSTNERLPDRPDWETAQKLAELVLSLGKPGKAVYIDIYPVDPSAPSEYTYEYTERPYGN